VLDFNKFSDVVLLGTNFVIDWDKELLPTPEGFHMLQTLEGFHQLMLPTLEGFHRLMLRHERHERRVLRKKGVIVSNQRLEKVAVVTCGGKNPLALGTLNHEGHPVLFHFREERWTQIPCMSTYFMDICVFKDRIYAVNKIGRTVAFGPHYSVQLVAEYVDGGDMKFLVESEGELLLVDIYDSHCFGFPGEDGLKLDVFRLDEKEKEWVKLTSLGDRILFLGNGCSFSSSASDLSVVKGNCVIFIDEAFRCLDSMACGMCVFHLDQRRLSLLSDYPEYLSLFWPPPEWIINMLQGP
jgi:hypothetical protein